MVLFPLTKVVAFKHTNKAQRWGQAFYNYMKLDKCNDSDDVRFFDKLFNEVDEAKAKNMVASRTDKSQ